MTFTVTGGLTLVLPDSASILAQVAAILKNQETLMSAISDWAAKEAAALASIQAGITKLDQMIQDFQNSPGTMDPADQAKLDAIFTTSDALATAANAIPAPPTPVPAP
jgi:capsule polysaccharide export protein KpsE/RkpR